jgi:hypothetical protein
MTPEQLTAIRHPCLLAAETLQARFQHRQTGAWSLVLSVNTGWE